MDYSTPYADLLPPLSTEARERLLADVAANGQRVPIMVTANGEVIDGHHRLGVCQELGLVPDVVTVHEEHPKALALAMNLNRRNLSPDQRAQLRQAQIETAQEMSAAGVSQQDIGDALGIAQPTVSAWFSDSTTDKAKDNRVKIPPKARPEIVARVDDGEPLTQVAADYDVTPGRVSQIVNAEKAKLEEAKARQADADTLLADAEGDRWKLLHGDFRDRLTELPVGSVDLIVTDPPYPAEFLELYDDLGRLAERVLRPQGIAVVLTGQIFLDQVIEHLNRHLNYGWVYVQPLPGQQSRIMGRHVMQSWKPWLAFSNGPWPSGRIDWHPDMLDPSYRAKDRYRWEQDPDPAKLLIDTLSEPDGLVLDPYAGTGSYGLAALQLDRRFIGVELDADRFTECAGRLP